ncbi:MAG: S1C family serine protease [Alphaproteobacteria bacterium]
MSAALKPDPLKSLSDSLSALVANAAPCLVSVHAHRSRASGFIWKPGLVVTADEALAEEGDVAITLADGRRTAASIIGRDPSSDIALLRADTDDGTAVDLGEATPAAGALALVAGSAEGRPLAAIGIVAASGPAWRSMRGGAIDARIELDLSLRRAAEGGVVLDAHGKAFGMAVFGPRRRVLVIPAATIARVAATLETHGKIARGYLGLGLQPVRLDREGGIGAMVMSVDAEGPGAKAGVHQGDVIAAWAGQPIGSVHALLQALGPDSVGTTVALSLRRGGEMHALEVKIGERP